MNTAIFPFLEMMRDMCVGVFRRAALTWAALCAAAFLVVGCMGPDPLPEDRIHPQVFLEERRVQDEMQASGRKQRAQDRVRELLAEERSPANLTLAARIEDDPYQALPLFEEALKKDPLFAWARYGMAFVVLKYQVFERYEESAENLVWLLERGFDSKANPELKTRRLLIENLHRLGRVEEEAEQLVLLLETDPADLECRIQLAWILCIRLDEPEEALVHIDYILASEPDDIEVRMLMARAFWNMEEYRAAAALYEELSGLHPNALLNLAFIYEQKLYKPDRALEYYRRYLEYDGYNADKKGWYDVNFLVPNKIEEMSKGAP